MMKIFITGATGFIGTELVKALLKKGYFIYALYRNPENLRLENKNLQYIQGDVLHTKSLYEGMKECTVVFHLAAHTRVWDKNPETYYNVNVEGTRNVLKIALELDITKVIVTSTAGVFGPSDHIPITENKTLPSSYFTLYEKTKYLAEEVVDSYIQKGLNIIRLYPTRVYGPGLNSESNAVTKLISKTIQGKWHWLPGNGKSIGNYVFIDDVVSGHMKALNQNIQNEKFILGGIDISYQEFFNTIFSAIQYKSWMIKIPKSLMLLVAYSFRIFAQISGKPPLITPGWVKKYLFDWKTSSEKAKFMLGYKITSLKKGIKLTVKWLEDSKFPD